VPAASPKPPHSSAPPSLHTAPPRASLSPLQAPNTSVAATPIEVLRSRMGDRVKLCCLRRALFMDYEGNPGDWSELACATGDLNVRPASIHVRDHAFKDWTAAQQNGFVYGQVYVSGLELHSYEHSPAFSMEHTCICARTRLRLKTSCTNTSRG
jgi:hypothetical protein